jgi:hypothetical protein
MTKIIFCEQYRHDWNRLLKNSFRPQGYGAAQSRALSKLEFKSEFFSSL